MTVPTKTSKARRLKIWAICLIIVVVAFTVFAIRVASQPSQPWISVNLVNSDNSNAMTVEVSNRMSFNVDYLVLADVTVHSSSTYPNVGSRYSIGAHSQKRELFQLPLLGAKATRWRVSYGRQLKPGEKSIFKKWPWLRKHYPFYRWDTFNVSEPPKQ